MWCCPGEASSPQRGTAHRPPRSSEPLAPRSSIFFQHASGASKVAADARSARGTSAPSPPGLRRAHALRCRVVHAGERTCGCVADTARDHVRAGTLLQGAHVLPSRATIFRICRRFRQTGLTTARPQCGPMISLTADQIHLHQCDQEPAAPVRSGTSMRWSCFVPRHGSIKKSFLSFFWIVLCHISILISLLVERGPNRPVVNLILGYSF